MLQIPAGTIFTVKPRCPSSSPQGTSSDSSAKVCQGVDAVASLSSPFAALQVQVTVTCQLNLSVSYLPLSLTSYSVPCSRHYDLVIINSTGFRLFSLKS